MLSCLTNDEMFVCLKYCLTQLARHSHVVFGFDRHSRQDFRELRRWGHDEALVGARPRNEVLDALIFKHAGTKSAGPTSVVRRATNL